MGVTGHEGNPTTSSTAQQTQTIQTERPLQALRRLRHIERIWLRNLDTSLLRIPRACFFTLSAPSTPHAPFFMSPILARTLHPCWTNWSISSEEEQDVEDDYLKETQNEQDQEEEEEEEASEQTEEVQQHSGKEYEMEHPASALNWTNKQQLLLTQYKNQTTFHLTFWVKKLSTADSEASSQLLRSSPLSPAAYAQQQQTLREKEIHQRKQSDSNKSLSLAEHSPENETIDADATEQPATSTSTTSIQHNKSEAESQPRDNDDSSAWKPPADFEELLKFDVDLSTLKRIHPYVTSLDVGGGILPPPSSSSSSSNSSNNMNNSNCFPYLPLNCLLLSIRGGLDGLYVLPCTFDCIYPSNNTSNMSGLDGTSDDTSSFSPSSSLPSSSSFSSSSLSSSFSSSSSSRKEPALNAHAGPSRRLDLEEYLHQITSFLKVRNTLKDTVKQAQTSKVELEKKLAQKIPNYISDSTATTSDNSQVKNQPCASLSAEELQEAKADKRRKKLERQQQLYAAAERVRVLRSKLAEESQQLQEKRQTILTRRRALLPALSTLSSVAFSLNYLRNIVEDERKRLNKEGLPFYQKLLLKLQVKRRKILSQLSALFPIAPPRNVNKTQIKNFLTHCFTIRGIKLPNNNNNILTGYEEDQVATALGHVAHLVLLLSKYLNISLRYRMIYRGSRSIVCDDVTAYAQFPLYFKNVEERRFAVAVILLNANIEHLIQTHCGLDNLNHLNPISTLENLDFLLKQELPPST